MTLSLCKIAFIHIPAESFRAVLFSLYCLIVARLTPLSSKGGNPTLLESQVESSHFSEDLDFENYKELQRQRC